MHVPHSFFFFNDTATTEIYTLSLHDALPICSWRRSRRGSERFWKRRCSPTRQRVQKHPGRRLPGSCASVSRSEEHTSELQSRLHLVCPLLLEKKKNIKQPSHYRSNRLDTRVF